MDLVDCLAAAYSKADHELNADYAQIRGKLNPAEQQDLLAAQRAWLQYRDAACKAERNLYEGGTGGGPAFEACLVSLTEQRISAMKQTYDFQSK